jgi:hypothetical protein
MPDEWKAVAQVPLCPSRDRWREQPIDVTGLIEKLRLELQQTEDAIRSLERFNPLLIGAAKARKQSVIEIREVTEPDDGS